MDIPHAAWKIVTEFEGCKLEAYKCPAGRWTIGYGHTGPDVKQGLVITQDRANELLEQDLSMAMSQVLACLKRPVNENQLAALIDFVFNLGIGNFEISTLRSFINKGADPASEFPKWNKIDGIVSQGLTRRRLAERDLWCRRGEPLNKINPKNA